MSYFGCLDSVMENSKVSEGKGGGGQEDGMNQGLLCPSEDRDGFSYYPLFLRYWVRP